MPHPHMTTGELARILAEMPGDTPIVLDGDLAIKVTDGEVEDAAEICIYPAEVESDWHVKLIVDDKICDSHDGDDLGAAIRTVAGRHAARLSKQAELFSSLAPNATPASPNTSDEHK